MSSMRLIIAAAVLAGLVAATRTCSAATSTNDLFDAPDATCAAWTNCTSIACTAASANSTSSLWCFQNTTKTCSELATIAKDYATCLINAAIADSCQTSGTQFGELGMALAGVMSSAEYAGSNVQQSCVRMACKILNYSGKGSSCATEFGATNDSMVCVYTEAASSTPTPPATPTPNETTAAPASSGAASVSMAVMAVLATVALLL